MITLYKDGDVQEVKERYLSRFLDQGWSQEPPRSKLPKASKEKINVEPEVISSESHGESTEELPTIKEISDGII
jgi:hypothetical protein